VSAVACREGFSSLGLDVLVLLIKCGDAEVWNYTLFNRI
jgi:hypothetical protein